MLNSRSVVRNSSKKQWLFVTGSLGLGGAEQFLLALTERLTERGETVTVLSLTGGGPLQTAFVERGVQVITIALRSFGDFLRIARELWGSIGKRQAGTIVGWMYYGSVVATIIKTFCPWLSLYWSIHHSLDSWSQEKWKTRVTVRVLKLLQRLPRKIHFCSRRSAETHFARGFGRDNYVLIYNGFDVDRFVPRTVGSSLSSHVKAVGHIARFHPMKDHGNFIAAVSKLSELRVDFRAVMVGKDVDLQNEEICALLERHGPTVPVALEGAMTDVRPILAQLDVLVVSSAWGESFPIVIGEAMASGIPCVATDVGDVQTLIGDTGFVVPPRDPQALAEAIAKILDEDEAQSLARRLNCRKRIIDCFAIDKVTDEFSELVNAKT